MAGDFGDGVDGVGGGDDGADGGGGEEADGVVDGVGSEEEDGVGFGESEAEETGGELCYYRFELREGERFGGIGIDESRFVGGRGDAVEEEGDE